MKDKIYLARSPADFEKFEENSKKVAHFFLNDKEYFYTDQSHISSLDYFKTEKLILNWFKNDKGNDLTLHNSISWGNILACGLIQATAYSYREYIFLKNLRPDTLVISNREDIYFIKIAEHIFKEKLKFYDGSQEKLIIDTTIKRDLQFPRKNWKFWLLSKLSFINTLLRPTVKLVIADGNVIDYYKNKKNYLFLNTKFFSKSLYYYYNRNQDLIKKITPDWILDQKFYFKNLTEYNLRNGHPFEDEFLNILSEIFVLHAEKNLNQIQDWICYYKKIFHKFKPTEVHFPGEKIEFYCVGAEVATSMGIKTFLLLDGVSAFENSLFFRKQNNQWLFDKYITFDNLSYRSLLRSGVPEQDIFKENNLHPMIKKVSEIQQNNLYDVVIFTWIPYEYNPHCFPDLLPKILEETITALQKKKLKIAVKFKGELIKDYYTSQLDKTLFKGIDIFTGSPTEVMPHSTIVITGISTAIFEAMTLGKRVFIFEPPENGYCKEMINIELLQQLKYYTSIKDLIEDI